ncbi:MAG: hypothetical protein CMA27_04050 [Euryarchaeota archaeon]|nr:hypothetical protein [Euryarchaeota archaeon]
MFRTTYYNMYDAHEEKEHIGGAKMNTTFMNIMDNNVIGLKPGYDYQHLDPKSGIIKENSKVTEKTVIMGMGSNSITDMDTFIDNSVYAKKGQVGVVDKAFMTEGEEGKRIAKVRIRGERIPQIGDKFCSRAGQKGTIGIILPECDMPCTEDGIRPDIIVNPHAMPSRMTIGHLVETLTSKTASIYGGFGDCTAFTNKGPKHKEYGKMLTDEGYHSTGNQILYNGMTGEQLETEIYFGPTYYCRLKHMPKDKINYRARGPRTALTRQTVQGRANNGGLRIGEMDRDCLIAHGLSSFIQESMMVRGDEFELAICNKTGCIAIYNEINNIFLSPMTDGPIKFVGNLVEDLNIINISKYGRDFSIVRVPYAFKLLFQELQAMNVQMRIITNDNVDQLLTLTSGNDIIKLTKEKFQNFEQLQNDISSKQFQDKGIPLIKEKTPQEEANPVKSVVFEDEGVDSYMPQSMDDDGDDLPNVSSVEEPLKIGDLVRLQGISKFNGENLSEDKTTYRLLMYDSNDLDWAMEAIDGEHTGELKNHFPENIIRVSDLPPPTYAPESPTYAPESPTYSPGIPKYAEVVPDLNLDTIGELEEEELEKESVEDDNNDEDEDEDKEKIIKTESSIDKQDTTGLEKLSTIDESEKKEDEEETSSDIKSITK